MNQGEDTELDDTMQSMARLIGIFVCWFGMTGLVSASPPEDLPCRQVARSSKSRLHIEVIAQPRHTTTTEVDTEASRQPASLLRNSERPAPLPGSATGTLKARTGKPFPLASPEKELLAQAQDLSSQGQWQESIETYRQFLRQYSQSPDYLPAQLEAAAVLEKLQRVDEALQIYRELSDSDVQKEIKAKAQLEKAIIETNQLSTIEQPYHTIDNNLLLFDKLNKLTYWTEAEKERLYHSWQDSWQYLGSYLAKLTVLSPAMVEQVLIYWEQTPTDVRPLTTALLLGERMQSLYLFKAAASLFREALRSPEPAVRETAYRRLVDMYYERENFSEAEKVLRHWQETSVLPTRYLAIRGQIYIRQGDLAKAIPDLEAVSRSEDAPHNSEASLILAQVYQQTDQLTQAGQILEQIVTKGLPHSDKAIQLLADCYFRQGNYSKAAETYEKILRDPNARGDFSFYQQRLGTCFLKTKQYIAAQKVFEELARSSDIFWQKLGLANLQSLSSLTLVQHNVN